MTVPPPADETDESGMEGDLAALTPTPTICPNLVNRTHKGAEWMSAAARNWNTVTCGGRVTVKRGFHVCETCGVSYGPA